MGQWWTNAIVLRGLERDLLPVSSLNFAFMCQADGSCMREGQEQRPDVTREQGIAVNHGKEWECMCMGRVQSVLGAICRTFGPL